MGSKAVRSHTFARGVSVVDGQLTLESRMDERPILNDDSKLELGDLLESLENGKSGRAQIQVLQDETSERIAQESPDWLAQRPRPNFDSSESQHYARVLADLARPVGELTVREDLATTNIIYQLAGRSYVMSRHLMSQFSVAHRADLIRNWILLILQEEQRRRFQAPATAPPPPFGGNAPPQFGGLGGIIGGIAGTTTFQQGVPNVPR